MSDALSIASTLAEGGGTFVLSVMVVLLGWAYWQEKKTTSKLHEQLLTISKDMLVSINGITQALAAWKEATKDMLQASSANRATMEALLKGAVDDIRNLLPRRKKG